MTISDNYTRLKHYFHMYIGEYTELEGLTYDQINKVFEYMLNSWYDVAEAYLGEE